MVWVFAALSVSGVAASGQSQGYTLTPEGQWKQEPPPAPGSDEAVIASARRAIAEERFGEAESVLDAWLEANERSSKAQTPEAFRLRGDALYAQDRETAALYDYELVIKKFPQSPEFVTALEREMEIALRYANGWKKKFLGLRIEDAGELAVEMLIRIQERLPGSTLAERAAIELADYYFREREMQQAAEAYELYTINFPNGPNRLRAMERRIYATIARFKGPEHDASGLINAKEQIKVFGMQYPAEAERQGLDTAMMARLDESAAAQMLDAAEWYRRTGDGAGARYTLKRLLHRHPQTAAARKAAQLLGVDVAPAERAAPEERTAPPTPASAEPAETPPAPGAGDQPSGAAPTPEGV